MVTPSKAAIHDRLDAQARSLCATIIWGVPAARSSVCAVATAWLSPGRDSRRNCTDSVRAHDSTSSSSLTMTTFRSRFACTRLVASSRPSWARRNGDKSGLNLCLASANDFTGMTSAQLRTFALEDVAAITTCSVGGHGLRSYHLRHGKRRVFTRHDSGTCLLSQNERRPCSISDECLRLRLLAEHAE